MSTDGNFAVNDLFFSDTVYAEVDEKFVRGLDKSSFSVEAYKAKVLSHLEILDEVVKDNKDLENVHLQFSYDYENNPKDNSALSGPKVLKLHLVGSRNWPQSKVDEFNKVIKDEKADVTKLKELVKKYPGKALLYLSELTESTESTESK